MISYGRGQERLLANSQLEVFETAHLAEGLLTIVIPELSVSHWGLNHLFLIIIGSLWWIMQHYRCWLTMVAMR